MDFNGDDGWLTRWATTLVEELGQDCDSAEWPALVAAARCALDHPAQEGLLGVSQLAEAYFALDVVEASISVFGNVTLPRLDQEEFELNPALIIDIARAHLDERSRPSEAVRHLYAVVRGRAKGLIGVVQQSSADVSEWHRDLARLVVALTERHYVPVTVGDQQLVPVAPRSIGGRLMARLRLSRPREFVVGSMVPHPDAVEILTNDWEGWRRDEVFLQEAWANISANVICDFHTPQGQERLRQEALAVRKRDGAFRARLLLRDMRGRLALAPTSFVEIDHELARQH